MKKILKNLQPSIRSYLGDAFCFSIINDWAFDSGWVYDKYIHLEYTSFDRQIKYADYDYYDFAANEGVFIKSFIEYPYAYCTEEIICRQVMNMLGHNEYCFALWDESVVVNHLYQGTESAVYEHGCFVYGYDSEEKIFYMQGYIRNEKWEHYTIPFDVFYKAVSYCSEKGEIALIGYKVKNNYEWKFDYEKMKEEINLYSERARLPVMSDNYDSHTVIHFFSNLTVGEAIHYPSVYCIYEHKALFEKRIKYLLAHGYIENNGVMELAAEVRKSSRKVLLMVIRYNSSMEKELLDIIYKEVKRMSDIEKELLSKIDFIV